MVAGGISFASGSRVSVRSREDAIAISQNRHYQHAAATNSHVERGVSVLINVKGCVLFCGLQAFANSVPFAELAKIGRPRKIPGIRYMYK